MRVIFLRRRLYRLLFTVLLVILVAPLLFYFAESALVPRHVRFERPRGEAVKVVAEKEGEAGAGSTFSRLIYFIFEFYQNKL